MALQSTLKCNSDCDVSEVCCSVVCQRGTGQSLTTSQCGAAASSTFSSATWWCRTCGRSTPSTRPQWVC